MIGQLTQSEAELDVEEFDRRTSPRLEDCVSYSIVLNSVPAPAAAGGGAPKLVGHTRDLSEGGLALIVPSLTFAYRHLLTPDFRLRLTLELPSGPAEIEGVPTHDRPLGDADGDMHYMLGGEFEAAGSALFYGYGDDPGDSACILGVKIARMSCEDRARYEDHLRLLAAQNPSGAPYERGAGTVRTAKASAAPASKKTVIDLWRRTTSPASEYSFF
jgi:hypothetical protein